MSSTSFGNNASNSTSVTVASVSKRATSTPVSVEMETLMVEWWKRKFAVQQQGPEPTWLWQCRFQPNTRTSQFWNLPDWWRSVSQTTDMSQDCICCICCRSEEDNKLASTPNVVLISSQLSALTEFLFSSFQGSSSDSNSRLRTAWGPQRSGLPNFKRGLKQTRTALRVADDRSTLFAVQAQACH